MPMKINIIFVINSGSMTTIKNIINIVDQWAPPAYAEDFDNVGLLIGDPSGECSGILVSLDCIEKV